MNQDKCQICQLDYSKHLSLIPFCNSYQKQPNQLEFNRCHLICAAFIKDVEIKIKSKPKPKSKQVQREIVGEGSVNLKSLEYSQLLCQTCNEINDEPYVKCIDENCNNYFHISCIVKNDQKIGLGRWSQIEQKLMFLEPICSEHENIKQYKDIEVAWVQVDKKIKQKLFESKNIQMEELSEDEAIKHLKTKEIRPVSRKESNSLSQEDSSITKLDSKQERKAQRKRQQKLKQQEENTTISNSGVDSVDNSDIINNISQLQYSANKLKENKSSLKRKGKQDNEKEINILKEGEKMKDVPTKRGRKKKESSNLKEEQETNIESNNSQQQSMSILEKVYKNNTLFKDCLDPTKSKGPEELIKKNKIKITCGIPQYPNTTESNRQQLMKQWWKYVNDYFFKDLTVKDQQVLNESKFASMLDLEEEEDDIKLSSSKNYRYEKLILRSQVYQSLIENDYYLNGIIPSLKNNQNLTVLYKNDVCNYLIKYEIDSEEISADINQILSKQDENLMENLSIISLSNINRLVQQDQNRQQINRQIEDSNLDIMSNPLSNLLKIYDIQGVDHLSFDKSIECTEYICNKQNQLQQDLQGEDKSNEQKDNHIQKLPSNIEFEILYLQEQLRKQIEQNNSEKLRIQENLKNEQIKYLQIEDLERESRKVFDIVKWNTIIRYMQVGYGEKNEEILLTYIKSENMEELGENKNDMDEKGEDKTKNEMSLKTIGGKNSRRNKIFQQICLRNTDGYIEIDCKICFNNYSSESNPVVYCSLCSASFHQFCYGIKEIPHEDFLCDLCLFRQLQIKKENAAKNNNQEEDPQPLKEKKKKKKEHRLLCKICMKTGFPMVDVSHQFYHVSCLIFLNKIFIKDSCISLRGGESDKDIETFQQEVQDSVVQSEFTNQICAICQKRQGYKIKCNHPKCRLSFHTHCAYIEGIHFDIAIQQEEVLSANQNNSANLLTPTKSYSSLDENPINNNFHKIQTAIYCPDHQPIKDRDEILQIYLRRYGINLYQTAVEYKDFNSFMIENEDIQKEIKYKIEDTRKQLEQESRKNYDDTYFFMDENLKNNEIDINQIFGDFFENETNIPIISNEDYNDQNKVQQQQDNKIQNQQVNRNNIQVIQNVKQSQQNNQNKNKNQQINKLKENCKQALNVNNKKTSDKIEQISQYAKKQQLNCLINSQPQQFTKQQQLLGKNDNSLHKKYLMDNQIIYNKNQPIPSKQQQQQQKQQRENNSSQFQMKTSNQQHNNQITQNIDKIQMDMKKVISEIFSD